MENIKSYEKEKRLLLACSLIGMAIELCALLHYIDISDFAAVYIFFAMFYLVYRMHKLYKKVLNS